MASFRNGRAFRANEWVNEGVPIIRIQNLNGGATFNYFDGAVDDDIAVLPGDLLFSWSGNRGTSFGSYRWKGPAGVLNQHIFKVTPVSGVDPSFLMHALEYATDRLEGRAHGASGLVHVKKSELTKFEVMVPDSADAQSAIAGLLDNVANLQRLLSESVTAKRAFKRALMNDLLTGRRRFPEFVQSMNFQPSPFGQIPSDWMPVPLSEIAARVTRRNVDNEAVVLTCSGAHGLIDHRQFFSKMIASEAREDYFLLHRGEFAYNRSSMTGYPFGAIKRLERYDAGVLSTLNICFSISEVAYHSDFAVHLFESGLLNRQLGRVARVGSRAHGLLNVTTSDFLQLVVPVPAAAEQQRIAATLGGLSREIELIEGQLSTFHRLKKGLMQRLLSGQVGVPEHLNAVGATAEAHDGDS